MGIFEIIRSLLLGSDAENDDDEDIDDDEFIADEDGSDDASRSEQRENFSDLTDSAKADIATKILEEVGCSFENPRIKPLHEDTAVELRARVEGVPMRVNVEYDMGWIRPELKISNPVGMLVLMRDHSKIAKKRDAGDDWADGDELRIFVAKGIFVEGEDEMIDMSFAMLKGMPSKLVAEIFEGMESFRLSAFMIAMTELSAVTDPTLNDLDQPVAYIDGLVRLMHKVVVALGSGGQASGVVPTFTAEPQSGERLLCAYCSTRFLPLGTAACPNCGAEHSG